jgi:hypothetical protein
MEYSPRDKVFHNNLIGGFHHGTLYASNYHANLMSLRKGFLILSPHKSTLRRSVRPGILPETENCLFQSLSPFYSPLLQVERAREWT